MQSKLLVKMCLVQVFRNVHGAKLSSGNLLPQFDFLDIIKIAQIQIINYSAAPRLYILKSKNISDGVGMLVSASLFCGSSLGSKSDTSQKSSIGAISKGSGYFPPEKSIITKNILVYIVNVEIHYTNRH